LAAWRPLQRVAAVLLLLLLTLRFKMGCGSHLNGNSQEHAVQDQPISRARLY
jgi:hypothetical protein